MSGNGADALGDESIVLPMALAASVSFWLLVAFVVAAVAGVSSAVVLGLLGGSALAAGLAVVIARRIRVAQ
ncbi:hypothetical protein [Pseudonocardia sp. EC080619-01]|uniref:hypothetical protein n=2 Tax=unclassified Pseudonocardia TaxID=2619320 RepID=UPI0011AE94F9|nr:hypothetical protein [Pseudonocardia sp. EC080619-01]